MRRQCFFIPIDFEKLYRKNVKPPFIPNIPILYFENLSKDIQGMWCWSLSKDIPLTLWCWIHLMCVSFVADSPGVPPSATAHELFRGFSYVASSVEDSTTKTNNTICSRVSENSFIFMS